MDTTEPVITVPDPIVADAGDDDTAVVAFAVTSEDDTDGAVTPDCDHASGEAFPLGETTVTCTATDAADNEATASFTVTVMRPAAAAFHGRDAVSARLAARAGAEIGRALARSRRVRR